jgi:hypothetical protein
MLNPIQIGASPQSINDVELGVLFFAMIVNSPEIASISGTSLVIDVSVDMVDQVGNWNAWIGEWNCNFVYDLPVVNTIPVCIIHISIK